MEGRFPKDRLKEIIDAKDPKLYRKIYHIPGTEFIMSDGKVYIVGENGEWRRKPSSPSAGR